MVTKWNPMELALVKIQDTFSMCLKSLPPDMSWINVKAVLSHQFSLVLAVTHAATHLIDRYQQKGESLQEFKLQTISQWYNRATEDL